MREMMIRRGCGEDGEVVSLGVLRRRFCGGGNLWNKFKLGSSGELGHWLATLSVSRLHLRGRRNIIASCSETIVDGCASKSTMPGECANDQEGS